MPYKNNKEKPYTTISWNRKVVSHTAAVRCHRTCRCRFSSTYCTVCYCVYVYDNRRTYSTIQYYSNDSIDPSFDKKSKMSGHHELDHRERRGTATTAKGARSKKRQYEASEVILSFSRRNDHPSALLHLRQGHWQQVGDLLESLAS
jgi:hypothetical protein